MPTWLNSDGLYLKSGVDEGIQHRSGQYEDTVGGINVVEIEINAAATSNYASDFLGAAGTVKIPSDTTFIPSNAFIESVTLRVETAFVGASATLDVGLVRKDRTTAINLTGFIAAAAVASLTAGATITGAGALVGTRLTNTGIPVVRANTAAFTAGKAFLRISYRI